MTKRSMAVCHYPLSTVKALLRSEDYEIRSNAQDSARLDFGWLPEDVVKCLLKLTPAHFYKTDDHAHLHGVKVDVYKARGIMQGENVYTHFHIHPVRNILIIASFKQI